jgi:hypothetical protein
MNIIKADVHTCMLDIPLNIKENIWAGEYIDLYVLQKSARELATDSKLSGGLSIKGGQLTVTQPQIAAISNIHVWTSAFMIFMGVMLEKWPNKGQEYLKYMFNVRLGEIPYLEKLRLP